MNINHPVVASAIQSFANKCINGGMSRDLVKRIGFIANPTEEITDSLKRNRPIKMYARGPRLLAAGAGARSRLEQNYLLDTRRFPASTTGETFPKALLSGEFLFFQNATGQPASNNGFPPEIPTMTDDLTNMDVAGQIAQGKNFVFNQIGISFNTNVTTNDLSLMMEAGSLRYEKQGGQTTLRHGPIKLWPGGTGIYGYATTTVAATTVEAATNGIPDLRAARKIEVPRVIREKESFNYKFIIPRTDPTTIIAAATDPITLAAPVTMAIWLWGAQQDAIPI